MRRIRGDMTEVYKILTNEYNSGVNFYLEKQQDSVRVQSLQCGTYVRVRRFPCGSYVNFYGLARVAIQGLTWVNF